MSEQTNPSQANNTPQKLRPMGFGDLLDAIFSLYRAHFLPFLAIASGYFIAILIVILIVFLDDSVGRGTKIAIWISTVSATFGVSVFVVSGLLFASTEAYLSRNIRVGAVLRRAIHRFLPCFIGSLSFGLLTCLCVLLANILFGLLIFSYISTVDDLRSINAFLVNFTIRFVFVSTTVCLAGFFLPYWSFFVSTVSLEGRSMRAGLRRSRELIRGRRWRVVGTVLAIFLLPFAIGFVLRAVFCVPTCSNRA